MLIVGELINSSRKAIKAAIEQDVDQLIRDLAVKQVKTGAAYLDVNCGTQVYNEPKTMEWLVKTIQEVSSAPLCIDSPSVEALAVGLEAANGNGKQQMVNSITAEDKRYLSVLPLVQQYKTKVVALCMDNQGMPETLADRIAIIDVLVNNLTKDGVPEDDIYLDPLVKPVSTGDSYGMDVLEAVAYIRKSYPMVHVIAGLSNVSFGLPNRKVLNRAFMIQNMTMGMDAFILDPLDNELMAMFYASQALLGKDQYCSLYLKAHREGLFTAC